jgi:hypothetical protein
MAPDPFTPIDGLGLRGYVEVCRDLVRTAGDSTRRIEDVLAAHDLTPDRWARISEEWSGRIRRHPQIRTAFRRLYAGEPSVGRERA